MRVTRAPTRLGSGVAVCAALVALGTSGFYSWVALALGGLGLLVLVAGLVRGRQAAVTLGACALFAAAVVAGVRGAPALPVLASVTCAAVAWDVGGTAVGLGRQVGREAETWRVEVVHAAGTLAVGAVTAGLGYGVYRAAAADPPVAALLFVVVAAVLLVEALG